MAIQTQTAMSGVRKAAMVLVLLGEEKSAEVIKHLSEEEMEELAKEMASLGPVGVSAGEKVLDEFHQTAMASEYVTRGDTDICKGLPRRPCPTRRVLRHHTGPTRPTRSTFRVPERACREIRPRRRR